MALNHSPKIVTNGLVFYYDQNNPKSYKGPAMQNLLTQLNSNYGSTPSTATGRSYSGGVQFMDIPQLGYSRVAFTNMQNNYTSFVPNSTDCCPSPHSYYGNFTVSPSTVYTYGIVYKCLSGYTNANYMYRYEYTASNGTYVTEGGVHDPNKRIHLGDNWYWAWNTFTTQPTTNWIMYAGSFYYRYSPVNDQLLIAKIMITPGDYTQLHPRYWPDVNSTAVAANTIYDMCGSTVSSANLTYSTDGSVSYNGSSNFIRWNNNTTLDTQTPTVDVWVKTNALSQNGFFFEKGLVNSQYSLFQEGANIVWRQNYSGVGINSLTATTATYMNTTNWFNIVATYSSGFRKIYINGVLVASDAKTGALSVNSGGMYIGEYGGGQYRYNGQIGSVRVYNKALTDVEVLQNFNAQKSRYGY